MCALPVPPIPIPNSSKTCNSVFLPQDQRGITPSGLVLYGTKMAALPFKDDSVLASLVSPDRPPCESHSGLLGVPLSAIQLSHPLVLGRKGFKGIWPSLDALKEPSP